MGLAGEQIMTNEYTLYIEGLMNALRTAKSEEKKRYNNAIDIEDMAEATSVTIDARGKILKLRKWIEQLQSMYNEINEVYGSDYTFLIPKSKSVSPAEEPVIGNVETEDENIENEDEPLTLTEDLFADAMNNNLEDVKTETTFLPSGFELFGMSHSIVNIADFIVSLCEVLIFNHPYKIALLGGMRVTDKQGQLMFSLSEHEIPEPRHKLSNGFYISTTGSISDIKSRCEHILVECGFKTETLKIY